MATKIIVNIPITGEVELSYLCEKECRKLRSLLYKIEEEFDVSLKDHTQIRKEILDCANFIQRVPNMISEVVEVKNDKS